MMGLMMLVSCNKDNKDKAVFHATIESRTQDRTYLDPVDGQGQIKWMAGDQIRIYNGNGENAVFTLESGANTTNGTFTYAGEFDMVPPFTAVYPHTAMMNEDDMIVFEVPAVQNLTVPGTFANGANPMLAYGMDDNLNFESLCGGLGIRLYGDAHVSSITMMGIEGEKLNGQFEVYDMEELESDSYGDGGNNVVTLTCDVTLTDEVTDFYAVLPVGVLHEGVIIEIFDGETKVGQIPYPEGHAAQVERNTIKSFPPVEVNEHAYVDLGLPSGLLWATCNVGADTPEAYGDYFAWGETVPKDNYSVYNYLYWNSDGYGWGDNIITKYCSDASYGYNGFTDGLTVLLPEDDAATANWGNGWRTPNNEEWQELFDNTTIMRTQYGCLLTASNGNSLFLPCAGVRSDESTLDAEYVGYYWSSLLSDFPLSPWCLMCTGDGGGLVDWYGQRYSGRSVRPVRSAQ